MYRLFDAAVACDFHLPGVPEVEESEADICIELGQDKATVTGYDWVHSWLEQDGDLILSCASRQEGDGGTRYLLHFPDLADFIISGGKVTCHLHPDCGDTTLCHLLMDQVIPRLWAHRGHLVVHASAVKLCDGRVIAFLGESGWGKSTLAAALQARGAQLLSDDSVGLQVDEEGVKLIPSYSGLRLYGDSIDTLGLAGAGWASMTRYSEKRRLESVSVDYPTNLPLETLYVIEQPAEDATSLSINPFTGAELATTLIRHSFLLDVRDTRSATRQLQIAGGAVEGIPQVRTLAYPRDYRQLSTVCDRLMAHNSG